MKKPIFGMLLGGVLGIPDGLSALVSAGDDPNIRAGIAGIVIGSTVKGLITGLLIGWFAKKVNSLPLGILFGFAVGTLLAFGVSMMQVAAGQPAYYWQIMTPGAILGIIVGYATFTAIFEAIRKAKSVDTEKLIAALRGLQWSTPFGPAQFRAVDHQSTMGAYVGKLDLRDGKGVMVDWRYADGGNYLPADREVVKMRPPEAQK